MKKVLFLCVGNSARSQMAEGFARTLGRDRLEVFSAGSSPASQVEPLAIEVMKEKNIDISNAKPKGFAEIPLDNIDYVVSMGCEKARLNENSFGQVCPFVPAKEYIEWDIPDPKGKTITDYRAVRDDIELKVKHFIQSIKGE